MESLQIRLSLLACILLCALRSSEGLRIGFGELDYAANEGDMVANIVLTSLDPITEDITIPIQVLTYDEFYNDMGRSLSMDFDTVDIPPDPAEYSSDPAGRRDFMRSGQILVNMTAGTQDQQVTIPLIDDDINEAAEGFFVVVVEEDIGIPEATVELVRDGVTLVMIEDNDLIPISFEQTTYSFQELEMLINSVLVSKEDVVTEQNLTLLVQLSTNGVAREGEDFVLENTVSLMFSPEDESLPVPFQILGDLIPEDTQRENFRLSLAISEVKPGLTLGINASTVITIVDNDIARIGFEQDMYVVNEDEGSVTVCIEVKDPEVIDLLVAATLQTEERTATDMEDFSSSFPNFLALNGQSSSCFQIPIIDDNETDPGEEFVVRLERIPLFTAANVEFSVAEATIRIVDDESPVADPSPATTEPPSPTTAEPTVATTKATPTTRKPQTPKPTKPPKKPPTPRPTKKPRRMRKPQRPTNPRVRLHNILTAINQGRRRPAPRPRPRPRPSPRPTPPAANPCQAADEEMSGTRSSSTKSTTGTSGTSGTRTSRSRSKRMSSKGTKSKSKSGQADETGVMCSPGMGSSSTGSRSSTSRSSTSRSSTSRSSTSRSSTSRSSTNRRG